VVQASCAQAPPARRPAYPSPAPPTYPQAPPPPPYPYPQAAPAAPYPYPQPAPPPPYPYPQAAPPPAYPAPAPAPPPQPATWYPPATPVQPGWQQPAQQPGQPAAAWPPYPPPQYAAAGQPNWPGAPRAPAAAVLSEAARKPFLIRPFFGISWLGFSVMGKEDPDVDLEPNASGVVGLRGGYGPFVASGSIGTSSQEDPAIYGKSSALDFQFSATTRIGGHEVLGSVFFQQYRNFFVENMEELGIDPAQPYRLPDMSTRNIGVALTYFTDPNFSYDDTFLECRVRPASEATWAFRLSAGYLAMDSGGLSLVPENQRERFGKAADLRTLDSRYASLAVGWASDWRLGAGFYIGMNGMLGLTAAARIARVGIEKLIEPAFGPSVTYHLITGYAGDTFHWGYLATVELESTTFDDTTFAAIRAVNMLFLGLRF
jgi:hypothetical protein